MEMVSRYQMEVREGMRPVERRNMAAWWRRCGMAEGMAVRVYRSAGHVVVVGGSKRDRWKLERMDRRPGEIWKVAGEAVRGCDNGDDGWTANINGTKRLRLTAKAMTRITHGLDEPFGDG